MNTEITLLAAFVTGLLGSVHCVGMCGGIVGNLSMNLTPKPPRSNMQIIIFTLLYNTGRISSYIIAGVLVASLSESTGHYFNQDTQQIGGWLSGIFMVLLGFYIAGWWKILTVFENAGSYLWRYLQPFSKKLLPVTSYPQALMLGALWGWLPCGMVYAMLVFALSSHDAVQGGLIMLAFGLGTLPMLMLLGTTASVMKRFIHQPLVRQLAGAIIILFGLYSLFAPNAHAHHHSHHQQQLKN